MISKNLYLVKKEKVHLSWPFLTVLLCCVSTGHLDTKSFIFLKSDIFNGRELGWYCNPFSVEQLSPHIQLNLSFTSTHFSSWTVWQRGTSSSTRWGSFLVQHSLMIKWMNWDIENDNNNENNNEAHHPPRGEGRSLSSTCWWWRKEISETMTVTTSMRRRRTRRRLRRTTMKTTKRTKNAVHQYQKFWF